MKNGIHAMFDRISNYGGVDSVCDYHQGKKAYRHSSDGSHRANSLCRWAIPLLLNQAERHTPGKSYLFHPLDSDRFSSCRVEKKSDFSNFCLHT